MASVNKVMLMGNLTRPVELRYTPTGMAVAQTGLAMNRKWKDSKTNEMREEVTFVDVIIWGKQAESCNQYMAKGRQLHVEGHLKIEKWIDKKTNQNRQKLVVVAEHITFVGSKPGGAPAGQAPAAQQPAAAAQPQGPEDLDIQEDNIPF